MKLSSVVVLTTVVFPGLLRAAEEDRPARTVDSTIREKYELPSDPKSVVISLDHRGGYTPPRTGDAPTMSILADGTVNIPANFKGQQAFQGTITQQELQDLLHVIIAKNAFFEYNPGAVQAKVNQGPLRPAIADAATTIIRVTANGKTKEVSRYAMGFGTRNRVTQLEQLDAIRRSLEQVRSIVQLGGKKEAEKCLRLANEHLKAKFPRVNPLTIAHLQSGSKRAKGGFYASFSRMIPGADRKPTSATITTVFINKPAEGEPTINVTHRVPQQPPET